MNEQVNIPPMPENWWPESSKGFLITLKDGNNELGFAITKASYFDNHAKVQIEPSLKALRFALWQARHMSEEQLKRYELKDKEEHGTPTKV